MKILIIGSKGFIGSHAFRYFSQKENTEVWGCGVSVDYVSGNYFTVDSGNSDYSEIFESVDFDVCINCSGAASVPDSLKHPQRDFTLNTANIVKILEAIRKYRPDCKFLNMSSAAVYGNPLSLPISENQPSAPVSPYGFHKWMAERICEEYSRYFGVKTCSLRIFSAYGPGLHKQLLWDIAQKILHTANNTIQLFGTGQETRDFIYISDLIQAIDLIIGHGAFASTVYNVGNGAGIPIAQVVANVTDALHFKGAVRFSGHEREGDPLHWSADISKIISLGYQPKYSLTDGVKKYVEWLQENK